ncbi:MAG: hypothetical protein XD95_0387 [Microgenomates bacterium 39_7]|nr:MAG: hypothetical protein XD95_0387 [Microgenomates bacterium 39_7]
MRRLSREVPQLVDPETGEPVPRDINLQLEVRFQEPPLLEN